MDVKYLTTGQAARHCSVTPDTVLKWIRSGFLPARRTAGGHHRIDERDLDRVLRSSSHPQVRLRLSSPKRAFRYCWEFNGDGALLEGCESCAVYQMRAQRCYEVVRLAPEAGHPKLFCKGSCLDCDYYRHVHGQSTNVLVVTNDEALTRTLRQEAEAAPFNLEITDCEYACSATINAFRPDYAVVDCSLGRPASRDIIHHLSEDPRIPFVRVVLAGNPDEMPPACEKEVFARLERPFTARDIADCIEGTGTQGRHP